MSRSGNLTMWQNGLNWMDDDEDQDSDTDSKLSGSAIVDTVMWVMGVIGLMIKRDSQLPIECDINP